MSSTLSRPKPDEQIVSPSIPALQVETMAPEEPEEDAEFAGFVRAIVIGVVVGVPVVGVLIAAMVKLAVPDMDTSAVVAVAVWVAGWIGVFLGGTVTVGLWSARQHRDHRPPVAG